VRRPTSRLLPSRESRPTHLLDGPLTERRGDSSQVTQLLQALLEVCIRLGGFSQAIDLVLLEVKQL
jgi:hypothetical protein